jgi:hypothetical protein
MDSPRRVARVLQRAAVLSPSASKSCTTLMVSGKAASHCGIDPLTFSAPGRPGCEGLWSRQLSVVFGENLVHYLQVARVEAVFDEPADHGLVVSQRHLLRVLRYTRRASEANLVYCSIQASWTFPVGPLRCLPMRISAMPLSSESRL